MASGDRSDLVALGDAKAGLGTASRGEGVLTSKGQDVQETQSRTYLRTLRYAIRGWLSAVPLFSVTIRNRSELGKLSGNIRIKVIFC